MKKLLFVFIILLNFCTSAQSWQWAKNGGGTSNPDQASAGNIGENVHSMAVDNQNNTYTLASISSSNFKLDGVSMPSYGLTNNGSTPCALLSSYNCNSNLRWSKVIGGESGVNINDVQTDSNNNVYSAGVLYSSYSGAVPVHIGNDSILPINEGLNNRVLYIFKYDTNGNLLWLKSPQSENAIQGGLSTFDLMTDPQGNSYWFCGLQPDTYCEGALVVTQPGRYILKYDTNGNYLGSIIIDYVSTNAYLKMVRNHNNGHFYLTADNNSYPLEIFYINGQPINHSKFIISFDNNGTFLWIRESESVISVDPNIANKTLVFDDNNNIYYSSVVLQKDLNDTSFDSFAGVEITGQNGENVRHPFIMKLDVNGNPIWTVSSDRATPTSIAINGNEVAITAFLLGFIDGFSWGNVSFPVGTMKPALLRFNAQNGNIIAIDPLNNTANALTNNSPTAMTVDHNNNYYMGGQFSSSIITDSGTITSNGGSADFYIAKFGTTNCAPLATEKNSFKDIKIYPNPVKKLLYLNNKENLNYQLFNALGQKIKTGKLSIDANLSFDTLSNGMYLLQLQNSSGERKSFKILKE